MSKARKKASELLTTFGYRKINGPNAYTATMEDYSMFHKDLQELKPSNMKAIDNALKCTIEILKTAPMKVDYIGDKYDPLQYERVVTSDRDFWEEVKLEVETFKINES